MDNSIKKGLIGTVNNVSQNIDKIKVWANSYKEVSDGEICLVVINPNKDEINLLSTIGIVVYPYILQTNETINNSRLAYQIETLDKLDWSWVLITDVFDVIFQDDPFPKMTQGDITVASEGIYHSEEPWNIDVIQKSYPNKVELVKNKEIYCSGVIGGRKKSIIELLTQMDIIVMSGIKGHDIRDQAALNIILNENPKWNINLLTPKSAWALHCAVGGPTELYEPWGFKKHFEKRWGEAKLVDFTVLNGQGKLFDIVHQFNRIPLWKEKLTEQYV